MSYQPFWHKLICTMEGDSLIPVSLQLYNGHQWRRDTGKKCTPTYISLLCSYTPHSYVTMYVHLEANFMMNSTNLTVGGFTQPAIARNLIEIPSNSDKGLSHRFIWVFPNPLYQEFSKLRKANQTFIQELGE